MPDVARGFFMDSVQNNRIKLSDHFTYGRLIRFAMPSIIMMIFSSIYGMIDGYFVSNYMGKTAYASVNLILPYIQIIGGMGAMLGADGSVLVARTLGTGNREKAGRYFTMTMGITLFAGIIFTIAGIAALCPVVDLLDATDEMIDDCITYGKICLLFNTMQLGQNILQGYLIVAEKPKFALRILFLSAFSNIVLNILFAHEKFLNMGVAGIALATGISQSIATLIPLIWFMSKRNHTALRFRRTKIEIKAIRRASATGSADTISALSAAVVGIFYNSQLMKIAGEDGVAAYGVIMYISFIFTAVFSGYSSGNASVMGYHYGAGHRKEMRNIFSKSMVILACATIVMAAGAVVFSQPLAAIFLDYDWDILDLTTKTLSVCIIPYLFMWFNIYAASVFSALNKGVLAAFLTIFRVVVFPVICIIELPMIWDSDGVWYALTAAELLSIAVSALFLLVHRKKF